MDVLKPELVWVGGRCYRFYESKMYSQNKELQAYREDEYEDNFDSEEEEKNENISITQLPNGKFSHLLDIPSEFYPFIIGKEGSTKKRIESETKTIIVIPKFGQKGNIIITGARRMNIISARNRINLIMESSRRKLSLTHFISIPMLSESIKSSFADFKHDVLTNTGKNRKNICEEVFTSPEKLHLTVCIMTLLNDKERNEARGILRFCKEDVIDRALEQGPISVTVKGVEIMNDDPSKASVLYAIVQDPSGRCQQLLDAIYQYFISAGLSYEQYNRNTVKMHMTLMNTKKLIPPGSHFRNQKRETFDATKILEVHKETHFGETTLSSVHLSQHGSEDENGYYQATEVISLSE